MDRIRNNFLAVIKSKVLSRSLLTGLILVGASNAMASSHSYINSMRSSQTTYVFVSQAIEGEYGNFQTTSGGEDIKNAWRGYGFRNSLGIELLKFTQFSISHTFLNMRSKENSLENLQGSRLSGEAKLVFASPIGNLEAGGGVTASRLDYQKDLENADFVGSGFYYTLGLNYFFSQKVSFFTQAKVFNENLVRDSGSSEIKNMKAATSGLGLGFNLWI